jgi:hypothetical protein
MHIVERVDSSPLTGKSIDQMAHYGITRVPVDYFHFREFRYTSFADALAEARRQAEQDGMPAQTR